MQQCNAVQVHNQFMVQQIPELRNSIIEGKNWEEIARYQAENYFSKNKDKREFDLLLELANIYGNEAIDTIVEGFTCPNCGKTAIQRCSRCKSEWYCSRQCQVEHYKKEHKNVCKIWAAERQERQKNKENINGGVEIKTKQENPSDFVIKESTISNTQNKPKIQPDNKNTGKENIQKDTTKEDTLNFSVKENFPEQKPTFAIEELD